MAKHSTYSPSSAYRWFEDACPASIRLTRNCKNETNPAAEQGTAAHELGEFCIRYGAHPADCIGLVFNKHVVDENMADAVELYVGWANQLVVRTGIKPQLEMRVSMSSLGRDDVFGTSDFVLVDLNNRTLYIADYKHGYGLVDVINNKQVIDYAISTLDTLNIWPQIDNVVCTIIQPRKQHVDGCIRSVTYTTTQLVEWQRRFANSIRLAEDPKTKPVAGEHCLYCPHTRCRARWEYVMNTICPDAPSESLTDKEIGFIYSKLNVVKRFKERIESKMLEITRKTGYVPEGYKPVVSIQRAYVENPTGLLNATKKAGIDTSLLYQDKLKSKTALKKILPPAILNKYFVVPPRSVSIAKLNDNRPAIRVGSASGVFKPVSKSTNGVFKPIK